MSADILTRIVDCKRREVEALHKAGAYDHLSDRSREMTRRFSRALLGSSTGIIAEFKRRSPSKGDIHPMAEADRVVAGYFNAGAACASVLTDTPFFGGALSDFALARMAAPELPLLRKEFIVDPVQITEAAAYGADAVLLIAKVLSADEITAFTRHAHWLGLEVLLELHGADELDRLTPEADMVGINNRNLGTFHTDVSRSAKMIECLPEAMIRVAESGITTPAQLKHLRGLGFRGFLIGETFMRTENPGRALADFISQIKEQ